MRDLIQTITHDGHHFDFQTLLELLQDSFAATKKTKIRFAADERLSFPPGDITSVTHDDEVVTITLGFMGLAGASSPLPNFFIEHLAKKPDTVLSDLIAIFNHRIYALLAEVLQTHSLIQQVDNPDSQLMQRIALLLGKVQKSNNIEGHANSTHRMLGFPGVCRGRAPSKGQLEAFLSDYFDRIPVTIDEWVGSWQSVPGQNVLGKTGRPVRLGIDMMLGNRAWVVGDKIRITMGPLSRDRFTGFLPGGEQNEELKSVLNELLDRPLEYELVLLLNAFELSPATLGDTSGTLGRTLRLGESTQTETAGMHSISINS